MKREYRTFIYRKMDNDMKMDITADLFEYMYRLIT